MQRLVLVPVGLDGRIFRARLAAAGRLWHMRVGTGLVMGEISLLCFASFALIDWVAVAQGRKPLEYVAKPATLAALILYAASGDSPSFWLLAALTLSLLGDVYLMLPANLFLGGLTAFLLGHLAYVAAMEAPWLARLGWLILLLAASSPLWLRIVRSLDQPALRPAVLAYVSVITLMVASALATGDARAIVGALFFFASDGTLAWNRFVQPLARGHLLVMVTYHLGQLGLTAALRSG